MYPPTRHAGGVRGSLLCALICVFVQNAGAQTIRGRVVDDSTNLAVSGAMISLLNSSGEEVGKARVRSDDQGQFALHAGTPGTYLLRVSRIGYMPLTAQRMRLLLGGVLDVELRMTTIPMRLGTVSVKTTGQLSTYELMSHVGFELRRSRGVGKFVDTMDLAAFGKHPVGYVIEDLAGHFGLDIQHVTRNHVDTLYMRSGLHLCTPEVWIDGFAVAPERVLERLRGLGSEQIYGVEVFGPAQLPSATIGGLIGGGTQYPTTTKTSSVSSAPDRTARRCGAVAVWTRAYASEMKARASPKGRGGG